jgi:hypothetical protein
MDFFSSLLEDVPDGLDAVCRCLGRHHRAHRPRLQSFSDVGVVGVHDEQDDLILGHGHPQPSGCLEAIQAWHS